MKVVGRAEEERREIECNNAWENVTCTVKYGWGPALLPTDNFCAYTYVVMTSCFPRSTGLRGRLSNREEPEGAAPGRAHLRETVNDLDLGNVRPW